MKKLIFILLMASIIFTVGCENGTESTVNTLASSSETEEITTDIIDTIPDIQYNYYMYDRFSDVEIANMAFSQKGLFTFTTSYYNPGGDLGRLSVGDVFEIEVKLTNMTNQTIIMNCYHVSRVDKHPKS